MVDHTKQLKQSTCPYCGVGCGIDVSVQTTKHSQQLLDLTGNTQHPANFGRLCIKGQSLLETTQVEGRMLHPTINGERKSWDEATTHVANALTETINKHGKDSVAFYVSGQLLTEDYYVANKLMKGFIGSANIDTNSRLCMSSAVAAYKRAFGEDLVPCCYEDLEKTDLLVLIGSNAAWTHPVLFQRMERAKRINPLMRVIQIDPRKTATSSLVDIFLPIKPGTDAVLFNGLLRHINLHALDAKFVQSYTNGIQDALTQASEFTAEKVAQICEVTLGDVRAFYDAFSASASAVSFYSMGINQSTSGVDKANAIINCHLASGKIGKEGCGPFSITGQPNAMGGREVGGLANMLAAHMSFEPRHIDLVSRFWNTNSLATQPGLNAVDLFEAIDEGKVKFIWIMGTNPVASMPNRSKIEAALKKCDTVVVSDVVQSNDTLQFAHVALPATPWAEKDGTVTNSERCISRQRALVNAQGEAKHDWKIICEVASKMGFSESFSFVSPSQIFKEHARLTAFENDGERALNLKPLGNLSEREYQTLSPVQWPFSTNADNPQNSLKRLFENNRFFTPNQRAQFIAITPRIPKQLTSIEFPFVLNTGRMRDHWHTMTRTANAARLHQHSNLAYLSIHSSDAHQLSLQEDDLVDLSASSNTAGRVILPVQFDDNLRKGSLFAPIHWTNEWASNASVAWLFSSDADPISGQPELKHAAVSVTKLGIEHYAMLATRNPLTKSELKEVSDYWTCTKLENSYVYRLAALSPENNWLHVVKNRFAQDATIYEHDNTKTRTTTCAALVSNKLVMLLHITPTNPMFVNEWLESLFDTRDILTDLPQILRFSPALEFLQGKLICSCHKVRTLPITQAIENGIDTLEALGAALKCGTNCGSCKSEVSALIDATKISTNESLTITQQVV